MRTNIENLLKEYQDMHSGVVLKLINIHLNGSSSILLMEKALLEHMINNLKGILELDEIKTLIEQKEKELEEIKKTKKGEHICSENAKHTQWGEYICCVCGKDLKP